MAAKTLLHACPDTFSVTILEKWKTIGGLWPTEPDQHEGLLNPDMPTNLSKYTVSFSDLAWSSVDLSIHPTPSMNGAVENTDPAKQAEDAPMFPRAWHVGRYLETYARKYLRKARIRTDCTVTSAVRELCGDAPRWKVDWTSPTVDPQNGIGSLSVGNRSRTNSDARPPFSDVFDYLVVASGFFGTPKIPSLPGLDMFPGVILHSTELRKLDELGKTNLTSERKGHNTRANGDQGTGKALRIVVVGGGMSGAEAAASLAFGFPSQENFPQDKLKGRTNHQISHVISRPLYALPTYTPIDPKRAAGSTSEGLLSEAWNDAPCFAPLDLCLYNLTRRRPGLIAEYTGAVNAAQSRSTHGYLSGLVGGDQLELGSEALHITSQNQDKPPRVVISDGYSEYVRSGAIVPVLGRVEGLGVSQSGEGSVKISCAGDDRVLDDVIVLVLATGFTPQASLNWLPKDVLDTLQHDKDHSRLPVILQHGSYRHSDIANLGFVGFYEGPYWGIMEMQARLLVRKWTNDIYGGTSHSPPDTGARESERQQMLALRTALREEPESFSQFWMGDYAGFMESFARDLGIARTELEGFEERGGPMVPARYPYTGDDARETIEILAHLDSTLQRASAETTFVAKAAFRAMQGTWNIRRFLKSAIPAYPSGNFTGIADFHPMQPTDKKYDAEYLYVEEGELVTDSGIRMGGSRRYVYRYQEKTDAMTAWFVKPEDGRSVDYFFHELQFNVADKDRKGAHADEEGWSATSHHLCIADDYDVSYRFQFRGAALRRFMIRYQVRGPKKDYVSETWYERPEHNRS